MLTRDVLASTLFYVFLPRVWSTASAACATTPRIAATTTTPTRRWIIASLPSLLGSSSSLSAVGRSAPKLGANVWLMGSVSDHQTHRTLMGRLPITATPSPLLRMFATTFVIAVAYRPAVLGRHIASLPGFWVLVVGAKLLERRFATSTTPAITLAYKSIALGDHGDRRRGNIT